MFLFKRASPLRRPPSLTTSNILHGQRQRPRGTGFAVGSAIIIVQIFLRRAELSCAGFGMPGGPAMVSGCSGGVSGRVLGCHCRDLGGSWGDACDLWGGGSCRIPRVSWGGLGAVLERLWGYVKGTWFSRKAGKRYWVHSGGFAGCWGLRVVFWGSRARSPGFCRRLGAVFGATQRTWLHLQLAFSLAGWLDGW